MEKDLRKSFVCKQHLSPVMLITLLLAGEAFVAPAAAQLLEVRTAGPRIWKTQDGARSIEAIHVWSDKRFVRLEIKDGSGVSVARSVLDQASLNFLKRLAEHEHAKLFEYTRNCGVDEKAGGLPLISMSLRVGRQTADQFAYLKSIRSLRSLRVDGRTTTLAVLQNLSPSMGLKQLSLFRQATFQNGQRTMDHSEEELKQVAKLSSLEGLGIRVNDEGAKQLGKLTQLKRLFLDVSTLGDAGLAHLETLTKLEELSLQHSRITDSGLASIAKMPRLRRLSLLYTRTSNDGLASLKKLPLERLEVGSRIRGPGFAHFAGSKTLNRLLRTTSSHVFDDDLQAFSKLPLNELYLASDSFSDVGLAYLKSFENLKKVSLHRRDATDPDMKHFADLPVIETLSFAGAFKGPGLQYLAKLSTLKSLRFVSRAGLQPSSVTHLGDLKSLEELTLVAGRPGVWGSELSVCAQLPKLRSLELTSTDLSSSGWQSLAKCKQLKRLVLIGGIRDEHLRIIAPLDQLEMLVIPGSRISPTGIAYLGKLKRLKSLNLSNTNVTDEGLAALTELGRLETLNLSRTLITDAGVDSLAQLKKLKRIQLANTRLSTDARKGLQRRLPFLIAESPKF